MRSGAGLLCVARYWSVMVAFADPNKRAHQPTRAAHLYRDLGISSPKTHDCIPFVEHILSTRRYPHRWLMLLGGAAQPRQDQNCQALSELPLQAILLQMC